MTKRKDNPRVRIGTIKLFDPVNKRGVIAPQEQGVKQSSSKDLYFEASDDEALRLRVGQLVQFVMEETAIGEEAEEAKDVTVLSDRA